MSKIESLTNFELQQKIVSDKQELYDIKQLLLDNLHRPAAWRLDRIQAAINLARYSTIPALIEMYNRYYNQSWDLPLQNYNIVTYFTPFSSPAGRVVRRYR